MYISCKGPRKFDSTFRTFCADFSSRNYFIKSDLILKCCANYVGRDEGSLFPAQTRPRLSRD